MCLLGAWHFEDRISFYPQEKPYKEALTAAKEPEAGGLAKFTLLSQERNRVQSGLTATCAQHWDRKPDCRRAAETSSPTLARGSLVPLKLGVLLTNRPGHLDSR